MESERGGEGVTERRPWCGGGGGRMSRSRADRRREGDQGDYKNNLPFVGRVSGQVQLYRERERGQTDRDGENQYHKRGTPRSLGGNRLLPGRPHPPPHPSTTSCTGSAGKTLKRQDVGQAVRGGKALFMIVYMSPLQSNSTFLLYSPTILLEK